MCNEKFNMKTFENRDILYLFYNIHIKHQSSLLLVFKNINSDLYHKKTFSGYFSWLLTITLLKQLISSCEIDVIKKLISSSHCS